MRLRRRSVLIGLGVLAGILLLFFSHTLYAWLFPRANFARITGYSLPSGVRVVTFKSRLCDNLFRSCYYWTLEAPPGAILSGPRTSRMRTDFDDADGYLLEALEILEPSTRPEDVPERYIFYRDKGRSQFLFRHTNGTRCYYLVSTL